VAACGQWRSRGGERSAPGALRPKTDAQLAEQVGISERTVEQAKATIRAGLGDELKDGKVSAKTGAEVAKLPAAKREKAVRRSRPARSRSCRSRRPSSPAARSRNSTRPLKAELVELKEKNGELADVARELNDKLEAFETTEPDEQQKLIADLQLKLRRKEAEIDRLRVQIRDANNKNNELIRTVKRLQKNAG
jgi:predicted RNase H-like nuclease (RuvC/YqgF family)